jgi:hypothetical protein
MKRATLAAMALAPIAAIGCAQGSVTEVVLVLTSDIAVPSDADSIQVVADFEGSPSSPGGFVQEQSGLFGLSGFPVSVGFVSSNGDTPGFSVAIDLDRSFTGLEQQIIVRRHLTGIAFVKGEMRMLIVPLSKACACQGTTCPNPGNPACDDIVNPDTEPFDPARAPPSSSAGPGIVLGGPDAGVSPPPLRDSGSGPIVLDAGPRDAVTVPPDAGPPDGAREGGVTDGAAPDAGHVDGNSLDGNGVDGNRLDGSTVDGSAVDGSAVDGGVPDANSADGGAAEAGAPEAGVTEGGVG